ncbi:MULTISPECIES: hypothetical protein [Pseudomonas]|uniref:hypothetical protein n=1 Tax=Pseudomonas TaxID=286 RepID=UPI0012E318AB|nr:MULTISPECIES: hypothetical protein [Pseudomonas]
MSEHSSAIGIAMRRLSSALLRLTSEDLSKLVDPAYDVEIKITRRRAKEEAGPDVLENISSIIDKLTHCASREDAAAYLDDSFSTKKPLEQIARFLDIAINKKDRLDNLRDKIIESTTGARIRSEAIKGVE